MNSDVPIKELLVALPIVNAPCVPDNLQCERGVFRPRSGKHAVNGTRVHVDRQALKRVQCGRESRAECRCTVLGYLVVCDGLRGIHEGALGHGRADIGIGTESRTRRKQNIEKVGIEELRDVRESDDLRGGGSSTDRSRHL
jgi:hypothetical protein